MGAPTEDWSEFIPPGAEVVELAGKWKHGWIPLDAAAVSSKMKGKTGGKKWWGGGSGGNGRAKLRAVPKKGGSNRTASQHEPRSGDLLGERNIRKSARDFEQGLRNEQAGTRVLNSGQVPKAKVGRRPTTEPKPPFKKPSSGSIAGKRDQRANNRLQARDMSDAKFNDTSPSKTSPQFGYRNLTSAEVRDYNSLSGSDKYATGGKRNVYMDARRKGQSHQQAMESARSSDGSTDTYQRGKIGSMKATTEPHPLTRSRKPISQMSDRERTDEANRADRMAERQPNRSGEWEALARSLRAGRGRSGRASAGGKAALKE